jgi:hypothetical protein
MSFFLRPHTGGGKDNGNRKIRAEDFYNRQRINPEGGRARPIVRETSQSGPGPEKEEYR